jgi:hypothetical protein
LFPRNIPENLESTKTLRDMFVKDGTRAAILGRWFAQHSLSTIAAYLKVVF